MSSRAREVEHHAASQCEYDTLTTSVTKASDGIWDEHPSLAEGGGDPMPDAAAVPVVSLRDGTSIRVAPMERKCGGWDDEHFHDRLRLPEGVSAGRGMVVTLEAMARECVAVALSPTPYFDMGKTYVVHFGAAGNLSTVLRRRLPNESEAVDATFPSRVCTDNRFQPYWIILQNGILSCGVGAVPGRRCIGTLNDSLYNQLRSGVDAVRCVGIGNSALGRHSRDLRVRKVRVMSIPAAFGMEGIPLEEVQDQQGFINVTEDRAGSGGMASPAASGAGVNEAELLAEYEKECAKARARAAKFGTEYKQPPPDAFFKWSEARRLRANPERGFVTGFDVMSPDERAKAERRRERFAEEDKKRKMERGEDVEGDDENENMEDDDAGGGDEGFGANADSKEPLPVEQAWDNEDLVREHRIDPPQKLYAKSEQREDTDEEEKPTDGDDGSGDRKDDIATDEDGEANAILVPEKIHIFGIDWAAFKQIRSDDIMAYFAAYGPSYVEWLGELSCNVLFEDKFSAARALAALTQEMPSPPPELPEPSDPATETPIAENSAMGDESRETDGAALSTTTTRSDLGRMGWRFCNLPIRKVANDRFGRRGTRSRILMRVATSLDVLVQRPTEWPKPPPGFTTKRVLGPGSDFDTNHHRGDRRSAKRRKRNSGGRSRGDRYSDDDDYGYDDNGEAGMEDEPSMDQGLKSGRAGFSVEEMEAEREARRKTVEAGTTDIGAGDDV